MTDVKQLITEHLDIWLTAETEKKFGRGRSSGSSNTIYGVQKLRELILELAVIGRLTTQDYRYSANDEFQDLSSEAKKLQVAEKFKTLESRPHNISLGFNVPDNWKICLFDEIAAIARGGSPRPIKNFITNEDDKDGVNWIKIGDSERGSIYINSTSEKIKSSGVSSSRMVYPDDLILSNSMSFGYPYIMGIEGCIHDGWLVIRTPKQINKLFLYYLLRSPYARKQFTKSAAGAVVQNLNADKVKELILPLPPLEEQQRIVEKVDELMQLCDQLEQQQSLSSDAHVTLVDTLLKALTKSSDADEFQDNWQRIVANFDVLFSTDYSIEQLKQTVLQLAVMGKLVKQDPSDEPASELLKKIADEKAKLIKEGKIKKSKPLPEITEDEKPFELPSGWAWEKLGNLTSKITDGDHQTPPRIETGELLLSAKNIRDGYLDFENCDHISKADYEKSRERCLPKQGDLLIVSVGGTIGRSSLVSEKSNFALVRSVALIKPIGLVSEYLKLAMDSRLLQDAIHSNKRGGAQPCLYLSEIQKFIFPLPPKQEQQRIVEKVNQLFSMIEQLQVLQSKLQKTKLHLADALVANAVEGV